MRKIIRLGDRTTHGGQVVSCEADHFKVHGRPVACVGDKCSCPVPGHGVCTIIEGDARHRIDGRPVAYEGHKTSCGAALLASDPRLSIG
jgi:uncharacterized Zn-binding protein involved in type VI secretion